MRPDQPVNRTLLSLRRTGVPLKVAEPTVNEPEHINDDHLVRQVDASCAQNCVHRNRERRATVKK